MIIKIIGAIFIIAACGSFGLLTAANHRKSVKMMRQLLFAIEGIVNNLRYRMSSLPDVFRYTAQTCDGTISRFFNTLANELEKQISPDTATCIDAALSQTSDLPVIVKDGILLMGKSLGHFDLEGQLKGLESVYAECSVMLEAYTANQDMRLRSYQTLALCAGAAVVILFI